ncbi:MAG: L-serine ammonia-lyase, iron-sulfur-dependent subunit beta [Clostridium sp.]|nr:L-serine ammonia-lyase, iron-sulfur-dependent subunit beta [Clostridium sp.]
MEKTKTLFDVIGPVIIGPSSSHTAGAVRIGLLAGKIFGECPVSVKFRLYNSFAKTGRGHGTDKGLLGGVLGLDVDNSDIKSAFELAKKLKVKYEFEYLEDYNRHPNSVDIILKGQTIPMMEVSGVSLGAGEVKITRINGYKFNIDGDYNTLILIYKDKPGMVYRVTALLQGQNLNIASMHCDRNAKGGEASMGLCLDAPVSDYVIQELDKIDEVYLIRNLKVLKK